MRISKRIKAKLGFVIGAVIVSSSFASAKSYITIDDAIKTNIIDTVKDLALWSIPVAVAIAVLYFLIKLIKRVMG